MTQVATDNFAPMPFAGGGGPAKPATGRQPSAGNAFRDRRFLAAAGVLLVCAAGFRIASDKLQLHFRKEAVPLPVRALDDKIDGLPAKVGGRWLQVTEDVPLNADVEHALGTKQYVSRIYVDLTAVHRSEDELKGRDPKKVAALLEELRVTKPEAVIHAHMTYYTGLVDTVAHIPDRCMVADGFQPAGYEVVAGPAEYADGKPRPDLSYRFITFEDITGRSRVTRNVAYTFRVNGKYTDDPLAVRGELQKLWERYGYYAKIELMTESSGKADAAARDRSAKATAAFMAAFVPEAERRLPDWDKVNASAAK